MAIVGAPTQVILTGLNAHAFLPSPDNHLSSPPISDRTRSSASASTLAAGTLTSERSGRDQGCRKERTAALRCFIPTAGSSYRRNELSAALLVFSYDAARGTWQQIQQASALPEGFGGKESGGKPWAADIHLTPDGRFLYASERTSSTISAFRVDAESGRVTPRRQRAEPRSSRAVLVVESIRPFADRGRRTVQCHERLWHRSRKRAR